MSSHNPLRSVTHRLNSTPVEDLPIYAGYLASSILNCADLFKAFKDKEGEAAVVLHRLRTRISSLLQDRTSEGRFVGVVLAKSIIDAGGITDLSTFKSWVRSLLTCLNKTKVPEVQRLIIITLSRIFLLSVDDPSHIREVTTPVLPSFIAVCLLLVGRSENASDFWKPPRCKRLVATVLQCWIQLLPHFPGTIRPYVEAIRASNLCLLSDMRTPESIRANALKAHVMLHHCAPKNTMAREWTVACQKVIESLHQTANVLFRSLVEEWTTANPLKVPMIGSKISEAPKTKARDNAELLPWSGIREGQYRMITLLSILEGLLDTNQNEPAMLPISMVLDLTSRVVAAVPPHGQFSYRVNQEVGRDEREELYVALPLINVAILKLLSKLVLVYGQSLQPVGAIIESQICDVFEEYATISVIRETTYQVAETLIGKRLVNPKRSRSSAFLEIIKRCCIDLKSILPVDMVDQEIKTSSATNLATLSLTPVHLPRPKSNKTYGPQTVLQHAAWKFATAVLTRISTIIPTKLRAELDASIVLIGHQKAMLSSVLNPQQSRIISKSVPSIMPFLARTENKDITVEALLRPRMPLIRTIDGTNDAVSDGDPNEISSPEQSLLPSAPHNDIMGEDFAESTSMLASSELARSPRKRSFTMVDLDGRANVPDTDQISKRSRTSEPSAVKNPQHIAGTSQVDFASTEDDSLAHDNIHVRDGPMVMEGNDAASESATSNSIQTSTITLETSSYPVAASLDMMNSEVGQKSRDENDGDDDDDDEIPTIDATLSDEDHDDSDEDG